MAVEDRQPKIREQCFATAPTPPCHVAAGADLPEVAGPLIHRAVARSLARRQASYADEVERIVAATYEVIERTGSLDPTMRDILRQSGISTQAFYRHFRSKDELLLALLDDGRRQLSSYLGPPMAKADTAEGKLRAWIEGVMAQASDETAAAKTRPFLANLDRLAEQYPRTSRNPSICSSACSRVPDGAVRAGGCASTPSPSTTWRSAPCINTFAIAPGRAPSEIEHVIQFSLAAVARTGKGEPDDG